MGGSVTDFASGSKNATSSRFSGVVLPVTLLSK